MTDAAYCTLFDSGYLLKGVAMLSSLRAHDPDAMVYLLCIDGLALDVMTVLNLPGVVLIPLSAVEDDDLRRVKQQRSRAEYCWTLSPVLPSYILAHNSQVQIVTYLDADLMFFSAVEPILREIGDASIAVIEHRYIPRLRHLEVQGRFNVQWVTFRRDEQGTECLARWRAQCLDWCYARIEPMRMGDQKYLDEWPERYSRLRIIQNLGAGVAPWNFAQYDIQLRGSDIHINDFPLIFYHFHQLQILSGGKFDRMASVYTAEACVPEAIYARYERALIAALESVRVHRPDFSAGIRSRLPILVRRAVQNLLPLRTKSMLRRLVQA